MSSVFSKEASMAGEYYSMANPQHFWCDWRFRVICNNRNLFPRDLSRVLDVGCGTGLVMDQLSVQEGLENVTFEGCDVNVSLPEKKSQRGFPIFIYNITDRLQSLKGAFDMLLLLDVLEHVQDDYGFLQAAIDHVKGGGMVVITVPAVPFLYGRYDKQDGHVRRYSKKALSRLVDETRATVVGIHYWGLCLLPLVCLRYIVSYFWKANSVVTRGFDPPCKWVHKILHMMKHFELCCFPKGTPFGSSLICFIRKL